MPFLVMPYLSGRDAARPAEGGRPRRSRVASAWIAPARRRARRRARRGRPAPRREARERARRQGRPALPRGLRHREDAREPVGPHGDGRRRGHAHLHGARAGAGAARRAPRRTATRSRSSRTRSCAAARRSTATTRCRSCTSTCRRPPPPLSTRSPAACPRASTRCSRRRSRRTPPRGRPRAAPSRTPSRRSRPPGSRLRVSRGPGGPPGSAASPTARATPDPQPATRRRARAPWAPPSTPPPVRLSDARPSLTSDATVLVSSRGKARRAMALGAVALAALAGAWWVVAHARRARGSCLSPPVAAPSTRLQPAVHSPAPSWPSKGEGTPEPAAPEEDRAARDEARRRGEAHRGPRDPREGGRGGGRGPRSRRGREAVRPAPAGTPKPDAGIARRRGSPAPRGTRTPRAGDEGPRTACRGRTSSSRSTRPSVVLKRRPLNPEAKYLETYARGGLAYVAGKDSVASAALVEAFTELRRHRKRERARSEPSSSSRTGRSGSRTPGSSRSGTATRGERRWA